MGYAELPAAPLEILPEPEWTDGEEARAVMGKLR
jgi:hypothetical protein